MTREEYEQLLAECEHESIRTEIKRRNALTERLHSFYTEFCEKWGVKAGDKVEVDIDEGNFGGNNVRVLYFMGATYHNNYFELDFAETTSISAHYAEELIRSVRKVK